MQINATHAQQAIRDAIARFPAFADTGPRLVYHELADGGTFTVAFDHHPGRAAAGLWDFQNAVVRGYQKLNGSSTGSGCDADCG